MSVVLGPLLHVLFIAIDLYMWIIIISIVLSWLINFNVVNTQNRFVYMIVDFTHRATEPLLGRIRNFLPNMGGLDLSPMILILALIFVKGVVQNLLFKMA